MLKTPYFKSLFVLIALIGVMHVAGLELFLYWEWWYDIVMHFLGGAWVALATIWVLFFSGWVDIEYSPTKMLWMTMTSVLIIAVGWEVFEFIFDIAVTEGEYIPDTALDFVMDFLGAGLITLIVSRR